MILPVPKTLEECIAKLVEIIVYLEDEDKRRAHWEADTFDDIATLDDRVSDIELRISNLEADD